MKENPYFSIITPVYNVEAYLDLCIKSVLGQAFKSYELILVNDGSTDKSGAICDIYSKKFVQIIVIHQANAGLSEARNTGIKKAEGKYLIFLDSDDMLAENALENLYVSIKKYNEPEWMISRRKTLVDGSKKVYPCTYIFDEENYPQITRTELYGILQGCSDCWLGVWIFCVKKTFLFEKNLFFFPGILHEDEEWVPRLFFSEGRVGFNNFFLYINRTERVGSITATPAIKRMFDRLLIIDLLQKEFTEKKYSRQTIEVIQQRESSILFGVLCQFIKYKNHIEFKSLKEKIKKKCYLLKSSRKTIHKCTYYSAKLLGLLTTGKLLNKINRIANKL